MSTIAPKASKTTPSDTSSPHVALFRAIGLSSSKAAEAAKNSKSAIVFKDIIERHALAERDDCLDEKQAGLVAAFALQISKSEKLGREEKDYVVSRILEEKLKSVDQVIGE
jgi:glutaminyl-tRNA synthetase